MKCIWMFCRVIDNFGDIGVCWRLARQLAHEQNMKVVLWVDDWSAAQALIPNLQAAPGVCDGVTLIHWQADIVSQQLSDLAAADAVIETFACDLPLEVVQWMQGRKLVWLNLEYLTAESWVDDIHLLPSPQGNGIQKFFYCPGFTAQTGGLSVEQEVMKNSAVLSLAEQQSLRQKHGLLSLADHLHVYVFGYTDEMWPKWFETWQQSAQAMVVWLARGQVLDCLKPLYPQLQQLEQVGDSVQIGNIHVCLAPFVAQSEFDQILQTADMCVVRGEDSVLRALWQGQLFWWQIYRQQDDAHHDKLHAFWRRFELDVKDLQDAGCAEAWQAFQQLSDELNGAQTLTETQRLHAWQTVLIYRLELQKLLQKWRDWLWQQDSLATQLANFIRLQLK